MLLSTEVYSSADLKEITGWGQEKKGLQFHLLFFMVLGQRYLHSTLCISGELECILQNFKTRQICTKNVHWLANTGVLEGHSVLMELVILKDQENWRREGKPCWMPLASLTVIWVGQLAENLVVLTQVYNMRACHCFNRGENIWRKCCWITFFSPA